MAKYVPGVCNIGPAEVKKRRDIGVIWIIVSAALLGILLVFHANPFLRLLIFFPLTISFSGFYQAYFHFCAGFGMSGLYNVAKSAGNTDTVAEADFRRKDKKKAQQIFTLSIVTGIIVAIVSYFI